MMGHNIVISGYYGFANAGDEAMLTAIIESLRQLEGDMHIQSLQEIQRGLQSNMMYEQ